MRKSLVLVALIATFTGMVPPAFAAEIGVVLAGTRQVFWRTMTAHSLTTVRSEGAKVALLRVTPNVTSTTEREEGFIAVAQDADGMGYQAAETLVAAIEGWAPPAPRGVGKSWLRMDAGHSHGR